MKRLIWIFLLVSLPLAYSRWTYYCDGIKYITLCAGVSLLAILYFFDLFRFPPEKISLWKEDLLLIVFFVWTLVSLTASDNVLMSLRMGAFFFAYYVIFYFWRYEVRESEREAFSILGKISTIVLFIVSLYAFMQYYGIYFIVRAKGGGPSSIFSTLGHRNFASDMEILLFPLAFYLFLKEKSHRKLIFYSITLLISWVSLYMMQSRGALTGLLVASCLALLLLRRGKVGLFLLKRKRRVGLLLLFMLLLTVIYSFPNPISTARFYGLAHLSRTVKLFENPYSATSGRVLIWRATLNIIGTHPLRGVGLGRFGYNYLLYQAGVLKADEYPLNAKRAHNEYLQIWAEMGTPAFLFFLLFLMNLYRRIWNLIGKPFGVNKLKIIALSCGITGGLIHALFSFPFHLPANGFYLILMMAHVFGLSDPLEPKFGTFSVRKSIIRAFSLLVIFISAFSFSYSLRSFASQYLCAKITIETLKSRGGKAKAEKLLNEALLAYRLDPLEPRAIFFVARFYSYLGDFKKAMLYWRRFLDVETDWNAIYNLANLYLRAGRMREAERVYRYLIKLKPDFAQAWHNLGVLLREKRKFKEAEVALLKAISLRKNYAKAYLNLGKLYIQTGEREKGIWYIRKAVGLNPDLLKLDDVKKMLGDP